MPTKRAPRKGSLQFWPRKRAKKVLPSVNWNVIHSEKGIKGFICYKAGMTSLYVKDNTPDSRTKGKNIVIPTTVLEIPEMKIFSVRFYKGNNLVGEVLSKGFEKEVMKKVKLPKTVKKIEEMKKEYDDIRIICYSIVKKTGIKKAPDIIEIGLSGSLDEKINFVKEHLEKEISVLDVFKTGQLVDVRGLTKGKGFQGPVKRFGISLKPHKTEKGRRRPGSLGPWHPARVTFRVPMAGQLGMFTRNVYNSKIISLGKISENENVKELKNIKNFGNVKTNYMLVHGSVMGPAKRALLITFPLRQTKKQAKENFELLEIRR